MLDNQYFLKSRIKIKPITNADKVTEFFCIINVFSKKLEEELCRNLYLPSLWLLLENVHETVKGGSSRVK